MVWTAEIRDWEPPKHEEETLNKLLVRLRTDREGPRSACDKTCGRGGAGRRSGAPRRFPESKMRPKRAIYPVAPGLAFSSLLIFLPVARRRIVCGHFAAGPFRSAERPFPPVRRYKDCGSVVLAFFVRMMIRASDPRRFAISSVRLTDTPQEFWLGFALVGQGHDVGREPKLGWRYCDRLHVSLVRANGERRSGKDPRPASAHG